MSALGHYLERQGVPTAAVSLIREHSVAMRPPRTLWVPFELGRPLGAPGDAAFQRRVLTRLLALFDAPERPVLVDFDEEAPAAGGEAGWVCPVSFPPAAAGEGSLAEAVRAEVRSLRPWFDLGRERRGRTTVGVSARPVDALVDLLGRYVETGALPDEDRPGHLELKYALDDLLAYYLESATAQPGAGARSRDLLAWFWTETRAGRLFTAVRERALAGEDEGARTVAARLLVPRVMEGLVGPAP